MTPSDLLRFALGSLTGARLRTLLSLAGMAIGVAAVIILTALGEGARRYVIEQFANIGTNLLMVLPGRTETTGVPGLGGAPNDLTLDDAQALSRLRAVGKVAPVVVGTEDVAHGGRSRQVAVVGATAEFLEVRKLAMGHGQFLPPGDPERGRPAVVLGHKVARELFGSAEPVGQVVRVGGWRMRVLGVLASKGTQLGMNLDEVAVIPVATAMRLFDRRSLFRIMIEVRAHADLDTAKRQVIALLAERHGEEDVTVLTQDALISTFSEILGVLTLALGAIAAISLTVAGVGIMNVMLVAVSERTREVGLLRAVGVARRQVLAVFLAEAALLSAAGGLLGLAAGFGAVRLLVRVFPALPAAPPTWAVAASITLSLAVGLLFGLLPARRAARLDPVAALAGR